MQETLETQVWSLGWEDPLEEETAPNPVFFLGKVHGQRSLAGYSPRGCKDSDMTEHNIYFLVELEQPIHFCHCEYRCNSLHINVTEPNLGPLAHIQ